MKYFLMILVLVFGLLGCQNGMDTEVVTSGTNYTKKQQKEMESIDIDFF